MAHNFGVPLAIVISLFVFYLILKSYKIVSKRFDNNQLINKFWMISILVIFISHFFDIAYYDGRFNTISWTILAGIMCIIEENKIRPKEDIN